MSFLLSPMRRTASTVPSLSSRAFSTSRPSQVARMTMVGRIGTDPEISENAKGTSVIKYVIGTSHGHRDNRQTSWFRVASFAPEGPTRDYIMGLSKGTLVYFEGDATMRLYDDADGKKQSSLNLVQTKIEVLKRPQHRDEDNAESAATGR